MRVSKRIFWRGLIIVSTLLICFTKAQEIRTSSDKNFAYISFSKAMSADRIQATDRQAGLARFFEYLQSDRNEEVLLTSTEQPSETTMLRSIFIGEYDRLRGDLDEAARWYLLATQSDPLPRWQDSLKYAWRDWLLPNGDILITDFADVGDWVPHQSNNNDSAVIRSRDDIVSISYPNQLDQRDIVGYLFYPESGLQLGYHTVLSMRVMVEKGSFLTVDVQIDGRYERVLNYYKGTGDWQTLQFPLTGDVLQTISLGISEPGQPSREMVEYRIWVDWIHLELDE